MQEKTTRPNQNAPDRTPVTTLVFDFGRVITRDQDSGKAAEMAVILGADREQFTSAYYGERGHYDRGTFGSAEYWSMIASRLGKTLEVDDVARLVELDMSSWFIINAETTDFIASMRSKVARIVLLSNIPDDGSRKLRTGGYPWIAHFDELVLSCEHKVIKPEPAIYELCIRAAGRPAGECVLIDDIEANIEGARKAGMHGHVFTDITSLRQSIEEKFILSR